MRALQGDIVFRFGTPEHRVMAVNFGLQKAPRINWLPQPRPLCYHITYVNLIISYICLPTQKIW